MPGQFQPGWPEEFVTRFAQNLAQPGLPDGLF
jgi:hypothetical protein